MNHGGTVSSELQHAADNLHDLSGAAHGPAHTDAMTWNLTPCSTERRYLVLTLQSGTGANLA